MLKTKLPLPLNQNCRWSISLTLLKRLDVLGSQGDPDLVDLGGTRTGLVEVFLVLGHFDDDLLVG